MAPQWFLILWNFYQNNSLNVNTEQTTWTFVAIYFSHLTAFIHRDLMSGSFWNLKCKNNIVFGTCICKWNIFRLAIITLYTFHHISYISPSFEATHQTKPSTLFSGFPRSQRMCVSFCNDCLLCLQNDTNKSTRPGKKYCQYLLLIDLDFRTITGVSSSSKMQILYWALGMHRNH